MINWMQLQWWAINEELDVYADEIIIQNGAETEKWIFKANGEVQYIKNGKIQSLGQRRYEDMKKIMTNILYDEE